MILYFVFDLVFLFVIDSMICSVVWEVNFFYEKICEIFSVVIVGI